MTVEVGTEVGHATLGAMNIRQGLVEARGTQHGAEGLAGLGRIDGQGFTLEVEVLIFLGGGPEEGFLDFLLA